MFYVPDPSAPRLDSYQSEQTSKQAFERCLLSTFQRLAWERPKAESLDPWAGRVGGTNKQASKLPRSMAFGSLSYDQQ